MARNVLCLPRSHNRGIEMKKLTLLASMALLTLGVAGAANATIATVFNSWTAGLANFNSTVSGAGGTASHDNWVSPLVFVRPDYTVTRTNGGTLSDDGIYYAYNSSPYTHTSGTTISIDPAGDGSDSGYGSNNGLGSKGSGLTLTFGTAINSIGFEVGDWGTCCQDPESDLYISFGNNAPIRVGTSTTEGDVYLTNGGAGVYVAAFDDSNTFTTVHFWGDGWGEYLVMGGTISYAALDQGSLPPTGVPEPASLAIFGLGLILVGVMVRRRKTA